MCWHVICEKFKLELDTDTVMVETLNPRQSRDVDCTRDDHEALIAPVTNSRRLDTNDTPETA